jgi:predicted acetyltransferase
MAGPTNPDPRAVTLEAATLDDAGALSNLVGLYLHDLSEIFPMEVGDDGRFHYDDLPRYWSEPGRRFAFLIRSGPHLAGFALATRGSPASDDPEHLDVAEFFVLRGHRRAGVGRRAAFLLWNRIPGRWIVRVSEANRAGLPFWRSVVREYARGAASESGRPGRTHGWRVFSFRSADPGAAGGRGDPSTGHGPAPPPVLASDGGDGSTG